MDPCLDFIYRREGEQQAILLTLHDLITSFPEISGRIRYRIPFYDRKSWICYLNPIGDEAVELAFVRGRELSNQQGLLEDRGRQMVRGARFARAGDIPADTLLEILQEALLLDEAVPYRSPGRSRRG